MICPHCGLTIEPKRKTKAVLLTADDRAKISDRELFAYYKKTSPIEDVRFFVGHCSESELCIQAAALLVEAEAGLSRSAVLARLGALQDRSRQAARRHEGWLEPNETDFWAYARTLNDPKFQKTLDPAGRWTVRSRDMLGLNREEETIAVA